MVVYLLLLFYIRDTIFFHNYIVIHVQSPQITMFITVGTFVVWLIRFTLLVSKFGFLHRLQHTFHIYRARQMMN